MINMDKKPNKRAKKIMYDRTVLDTDTGEILEQEIVYRRTPEPDFIKLYLDCVATFTGISKSLNPILFELLKHMSYASVYDIHGGQIIYLNAALKQQIAAVNNVTVKRVEQALTNFVKNDILKRVATGTYQVNPNIFGRGNWKDIKNIRSTFDFGNKTIKTEIIRDRDEANTPEKVS